MRAMRWVLLGLVLLLGWLQYRLWFGIGSAGEVAALEAQVGHQGRENGGLKERNAALAAEVRDLKEGVAAVEERARSELGMIKPGELFYRVVDDPAQRGTPADAGDDADAAGGNAREPD
jgi:cell division protein FtsB